jgi:hypothetical protein
MVRPMMLQGCRKADRAKVVEPHRFATPNSLKSHGERNLFPPLSNPCAITPKLCMPSRPIHPSKNYPALKSRTAAKSAWRLRHRRCPTSRDFVPWRFLDAGRKSAWIVSSSQRPKTSTTGDIARPQTETLKAKKPRTMPGRMLLLALDDHNEAVYLSKLEGRSRGLSCATNVRRSPMSALGPLARTF